MLQRGSLLSEPYRNCSSLFTIKLVDRTLCAVYDIFAHIFLIILLLTREVGVFDAFSFPLCRNNLFSRQPDTWLFITRMRSSSWQFVYSFHLASAKNKSNPCSFRFLCDTFCMTRLYSDFACSCKRFAFAFRWLPYMFIRSTLTWDMIYKYINKYINIIYIYKYELAFNKLLNICCVLREKRIGEL